MIFRVLRNMLQFLKVPVTKKRLRNLIREQLYHGSIRTVTEVLWELNIESKVFQLEEEDILLLEYPIIVHFKDDKNRFVVVIEFQDKQIKYYDPVTNKFIVEKKCLFFEKWSGTVLIPFTDEQSGDSEHVESLKKERDQKLINTGINVGIAICIVLLLIQVIYIHPLNVGVWSVLFSIKLIALLVVSQIVKIELGESNALITKICKTTDCGKVLHSKASRLFSWLTMGDIGVIYFGSGTLLLIFAPFISGLASIVYLLFFFNLFTLPYTLFSISYQRFVLKTWCPFCFSVMGILWIEFFLGLTVRWIEVFPLSHSILLLFSFTGIVITIGWFVLKRMLIATHSANSLRTYVNIIKKDTDLFNAVLSNKDSIPEFKSSSEIVLGNKDAKDVLIAVISPNCPSCAALYQSIRNFLTLHSDKLKVILRFKPGKRDNGWDHQIIEYLLMFNMNNMKNRSLSILEEWYNMENKDINLWKTKCNLDDTMVSDEAKRMREEYRSWLLSVDIPGAPTMILNNKIVPQYYTFNDVKYFLKRIYGHK